jgi:hypothetical protein
MYLTHLSGNCNMDRIVALELLALNNTMINNEKKEKKETCRVHNQ